MFDNIPRQHHKTTNLFSSLKAVGIKWNIQNRTKSVAINAVRQVYNYFVCYCLIEAVMTLEYPQDSGSVCCCYAYSVDVWLQNVLCCIFHVIWMHSVQPGPRQQKFVDVRILFTIKKDNGSPRNVATQSVCWSSRMRPEKEAWLVCSWKYDVGI